MADDGLVLEIPEMVGIALSPERAPQAETAPAPWVQWRAANPDGAKRHAEFCPRGHRCARRL